MALTAQADRMFTAPATSPSTSLRASKPIELGIDFSITSPGDKVEIIVGDVTKVPNAKSGREMLAMAPLAVPVAMKEYLPVTATRSLVMPQGWVIPKNSAESTRLVAALDRLRTHGVTIQEFGSDQQLAVERFTIAEITKAPRPFQGHQEARLKGTYARAQLTVGAGSLYIPANQPLARLAFYLIEPESDDGLVTWNVIDEGLTVGGAYPIYRVTGAALIKAR